jgi:hypothetical protein
MPLKTGKRPFKMHAKTLFFEKYAGDAIPEAPEKVYWGYKVPEDQWGMLANDEVGDCVVAGAMHMDMNWTAHTGTMRTYTREQALEIYSRLTGYDPTTGANDNGLVVTDFLNFWQTEGFFGSKIDPRLDAVQSRQSQEVQSSGLALWGSSDRGTVTLFSTRPIQRRPRLVADSRFSERRRTFHSRIQLRFSGQKVCDMG